MSIQLTTPITRSARTVQLEGMFDLGESTASVVELAVFPMERLAERPWNIGLIVGPSGCGKTQTARRAFADHWPDPFEWAHDRAVVDEMPPNCGVKEIVEVLSSVGFSSPPAWLRPYHILSNGERFRVEVARALLERRDVTVVDEFTSVVDRTVAQVASHAVQKAVRRREQQLVAVTCHYDVEDWLQPDWRYDPSNGEFEWRCLQPRPRVNVELTRGVHADWNAFRQHHYLSHEMNRSSRVVIGKVNGIPAVLCAVLPLPHKTPNLYRIHRIVTMPDFQGIGVGGRVLDAIAGGLVACGKRPLITTSHPAFVASLNRSPLWGLARKPSRSSIGTITIGGFNNSVARDRNTAGFTYVGPANIELGRLLAGGALQVTAK